MIVSAGMFLCDLTYANLCLKLTFLIFSCFSQSHYIGFVGSGCITLFKETFPYLMTIHWTCLKLLFNPLLIPKDCNRFKVPIQTTEMGQLYSIYEIYSKIEARKLISQTLNSPHS